jgi:ribosomal protein S18 acetylase RimI-like enzyme
LARRLVDRIEEHAAAIGFRVLNLDVRETQESAIKLFESLGYTRWGTHPAYARVDGRTVAGHHYYKLLEPGRGRTTGSLIGG